MTFEEYQKLALNTSRDNQTLEESLINAALGLSGESGEFADLIKKVVYHEHPLDKNKAILEIGDILWYAVLAARGLGVTLDQIAKMNIEKLQKRYPNGFNSQDSINRND